MALCALVTLVAVSIQALEETLVGHPYVEAIVIAILLGTTTRTLWEPGSRWRAGIAFSAKQVLEVAVALLGASLSIAAIEASGPVLLVAIVTVVVLSLAASFGISRSLGLPVRLSILVACGNSICGNSAIAAVAPVIGASTDDVASSISFTAVLGVVVVLGLPLLIPLLHLSGAQYGVLACIAVSARGLRNDRPLAGSRTHTFFKTVPWFIVAFFALATLRSLSVLPDAAVVPLRSAASIL